MKTESLVSQLKAEYSYLQQHYGVKRIGIFGSYATFSQTLQSDIDLFIEFNEPIGLEFVNMCDYLESKLKAPVDILTPAGILSIRNAKIKKRITESIIYV
jgi:predicted nucleotidyltransferase